MAALTIGGNTVPVLEDSPGESAPQPARGSRTRAFLGGLLSTETGEKRTWEWRVLWTATEDDAFRAAVAPGAIATCAGDLMPAGGVSCAVVRGAAEAIVKGTTLYRLRTLTLEEV